MEATVSLNTKISPEEKREFVANTEALGLTPSAAIKVFVRMFNSQKGFPFAVRIPPQINLDNPQLMSAHLSDGRLIVPVAWRDDDDDV